MASKNIPQLFDGLVKQNMKIKQLNTIPQNAPYRLVIRSPNPNIRMNPSAFPVNPSNIQVQELKVTRSDYITPAGVTSAFSVPRPGTLALSGDTGSMGMYFFERLLDFYGRTREEFVFYNRNIEIAWGGVIYVGSFDDMGGTTQLPVMLNKSWTVNFTFFSRLGAFNSPVPTLATDEITSEIDRIVTEWFGGTARLKSR